MIVGGDVGKGGGGDNTTMISRAGWRGGENGVESVEDVQDGEREEQ